MAIQTIHMKNKRSNTPQKVSEAYAVPPALDALGGFKHVQLWDAVAIQVGTAKSPFGRGPSELLVGAGHPSGVSADRQQTSVNPPAHYILIYLNISKYI